jgi:predicted phosphoribosyltransferase
MLPLADRQEAGRHLAHALRRYEDNPHVTILALPRGGVLVGAEIARELGVALDVFTVRKLGVPWNRELAVGAIATGGVQLLDESLMAELGLTLADMDAVIRAEEQELRRREALYRGDRALVARGRTAILVDDGLATGSSMVAAVTALRDLEPARIVVAVPVASEAAGRLVKAGCDEFVCLATPPSFGGVGQWYDDFHDVSDDEVLAALGRSPTRPTDAR